MAGTGSPFWQPPSQTIPSPGRKKNLSAYARMSSSSQNFSMRFSSCAHPIEYSKSETRDPPAHTPHRRRAPPGRNRPALDCSPATVRTSSAFTMPYAPLSQQKSLKKILPKPWNLEPSIPASPSTDTLVYAPESPLISSIPHRADYQRGQTPQTFQYPLILEAHRRALEKGIVNRSDDCSLVLDMGHPVHVTPGSEYNIKITTELDLCLAEQDLPPPSKLLSHRLSPISERKYNTS